MRFASIYVLIFSHISNQCEISNNYHKLYATAPVFVVIPAADILFTERKVYFF